MELRLLGEVELRAADHLLDVGAPRPQAVLAVLAVDAGRPVAADTLIDHVWDDNPPAEARNVLYSYLSRIRKLLRQAATLTGEPAVRIERRHAGYVLDIDPDLVDLHRFRRLADRDTDPQCGDGARAAALAEALDLWRGPPLAGLPGKWVAQIRDSWELRRLDAVVQWAQIELRLGHPATVISTLPDLAAEYPLVEPLETLLMQALYAAGRGAEALDRYSAIRHRLADELGADPGPELRALHRSILRGEPAPVVATVRTDPPAPVAAGATATQHGYGGPSADSTASPARPSDDDTSSGHADAVGTAAPPGRTRSRPKHRGALLAALVTAVLLAASGPVLTASRDQNNDSPSIERAHMLFATAREFHQKGRPADAQQTTVDAVRLYGELLRRNPDRNAPVLTPAIIQALGTVGVDFSVAENAMRAWLANPLFTPYPAISQVLLLQGWRLEAPVFLDVIVWNYEQTPGITSPRSVADVRPGVLKTAVLEASNTRHGTRVTSFERLLKP